MLAQYFPLIIMALLALAFAAGSILASLIVSVYRPNANKRAPYECGMPSDGVPGVRVPVKYYTIALLFLVFDVETIFILIWAVMFKEFVAAGLGVFVFVEMALFLGVLLAGLAYAWKRGALQWK